MAHYDRACNRTPERGRIYWPSGSFLSRQGFHHPDIALAIIDGEKHLALPEGPLRPVRGPVEPEAQQKLRRAARPRNTPELRPPLGVMALEVDGLAVGTPSDRFDQVPGRGIHDHLVIGGSGTDHDERSAECVAGECDRAA